MVHAGGWACEWLIPPCLSPLTGGVAALRVMAVRLIIVRSVFCQYTAPADESFALTAVAGYL